MTEQKEERSFLNKPKTIIALALIYILFNLFLVSIDEFNIFIVGGSFVGSCLGVSMVHCYRKRGRPRKEKRTKDGVPWDLVLAER